MLTIDADCFYLTQSMFIRRFSRLILSVCFPRDTQKEPVTQPSDTFNNQNETLRAMVKE